MHGGNTVLWFLNIRWQHATSATFPALLSSALQGTVLAPAANAYEARLHTALGEL
jgi:hypothetical protein